MIADEPADEGGTEMGFSPDELLLASLGACTAITLRMYADRKGWALEEVKCNLTFERDKEKNITRILRNIDLIGHLSEEEKRRLLVIAEKCPTHQILTHQITIETSNSL